MKTKKENYTFSEQEITIAREIANGNHGLSEIRERLSIKPSLLSYYLKKLEDKRVITINRAQQFNENKLENSRKIVSFQDTKHASLLKNLLGRYPHIKWERILSGLGIDVLFQMATEPNAIDIISQTTFWRYLKDFKTIGIATCSDESCHINSRFSLLREFLTEYQTFIVKRIIDSASNKAVILWQKGFDCLIIAPKTEHIRQEGFTKTATSRLADFGIQLFSDYDTYFYSKIPNNNRVEDIILHTLLIESGSVRYMTYSLLLLKKELKTIDRNYLLKRAEWYDLSLQINAMLEFLKTKGTRTLAGLPTWTEFESKMTEYEIKAIT